MDAYRPAFQNFRSKDQIIQSIPLKLKYTDSIKYWKKCQERTKEKMSGHINDVLCDKTDGFRKYIQIQITANNN